MDVEGLTRAYLLYVIMPLWLVAGVADWLCHRASRIESTSGWKESAIHLLMLVEVGIPVLLALFLEINALMMGVTIFCFVAHEVTSHWDLRYALPRRPVSAGEQHVHNYLGALPFMAMSFVFVLHWTQLLALFGGGPEPARFQVEPKHDPLPLAYVGSLLGAIVVLELLPYLEEWWRGWRRRDGVAPALEAPARPDVHQAKA